MPVRFIKTTPDQIQSGDLVRITERYPSGSTITYEGRVDRVLWVQHPGSDRKARCLALRGIPYEEPSEGRIQAILSATVEIAVA